VARRLSEEGRYKATWKRDFNLRFGASHAGDLSTLAP